MPFEPGAFASIQLAFSVGRFGWTETYYHAMTGPNTFLALERICRDLAKARAPLCGGGVIVESLRLSDVAVRRDADDLPLNYFVDSPATGPPTGFGGLVINTAYVSASATQTRALIPNVAINVRVEAVTKVYHGQHYLSGIPSGLVGNDEFILTNREWSDAFGDFANFLVENQFRFPALNRISAGFEDRKVTKISPLDNEVMVNTTEWAVGDRIRIINAKVTGKKRGGSIVGSIKSLLPSSFRYEQSEAIPASASAGPKTIAHKEETTYQPISNYSPEYVTHRNRGRPLFTPRGRRSRR